MKLTSVFPVYFQEIEAVKNNSSFQKDVQCYWELVLCPNLRAFLYDIVIEWFVLEGAFKGNLVQIVLMLDKEFWLQ